jgi:hypothetical protein
MKLIDRKDLPVLAAEQEVIGEAEDGYEAILDFVYIVMRNGDILYHGNEAGLAARTLNQIGARDKTPPSPLSQNTG